MKRVLAYLSLLIVAFSLAACSPKTPEQQWQELNNVLTEVESEIKATTESINKVAPDEEVIRLNVVLDEATQKVKAVKISDAEIKKFQNSTVKILELVKGLVDAKDNLPRIEDLAKQLQVATKENLKLAKELSEKYPKAQEVKQ